jgi:thiosulfate/3-mercaptopyruvate sulfurtransferase
MSITGVLTGPGTLMRITLLCLSLISILVWPQRALSRGIDPIVSTDWLEQNLTGLDLFVLDIRNSEQYKKGHIPQSINAPFSSWVVESNEVSLELPTDEALRKLLGDYGLQKDSAVVVVNRVDTDFSRSDATRVAWTCVVAGIRNVAVLDGGYNKWLKEKKPVSTEARVPNSTEYAGNVNRSSLALKSQVLLAIGKSILLDTRIPEDYFGITPKSGHIKTSVNLPAPWAYTSDGRFRSTEELRAFAGGVLGGKNSREIIAYCGVGGFASTWWFLLTQLLGYQNVKVYDGSFQEWSADPNAPVVLYRWN